LASKLPEFELTDRLELLSYIMSCYPTFEELKGLRLIPLANDSIGTFGSETTYLLGSQEEQKVLRNPSQWIEIPQEPQYNALRESMKAIASPGTSNLCVVTHTNMAKLLLEVSNLSFANLLNSYSILSV